MRKSLYFFFDVFDSHVFSGDEKKEERFSHIPLFEPLDRRLFRGIFNMCLVKSNVLNAGFPFIRGVQVIALR